jgi:hypothetical protein
MENVRHICKILHGSAVLKCSREIEPTELHDVQSIEQLCF